MFHPVVCLGLWSFLFSFSFLIYIILITHPLLDNGSCDGTLSKWNSVYTIMNRWGTCLFCINFLVAMLTALALIAYTEINNSYPSRT
jgi:hypothetical protein